MNKYVPFLKMKQNEIKGVYTLSDDIKAQCIPFFELPYDETYDERILTTRIDKLHTKFNKYFKKSELSFYIDNYEVPDSILITGNINYAYFLSKFSGYSIIPVCGIDRTSDHNDIAIDYANSRSKKIGIRFTREYVRDFNGYIVDIESIVSRINNDVEINIILDHKLLDNSDLLPGIIQQSVSFISYLLSKYTIFTFIIAGSTIPSSISSCVETNTQKEIIRNEASVFNTIISTLGLPNISYADYTIISPDYSELHIAPEILQNIMTAKIIYTKQRSHYVARGKAIKPYGLSQYFDLALDIASKIFFRGKEYSWGDAFIFEKSQRLGKNVMPGTIIAPCVNAHITYIVKTLQAGSIM